MKILRVIFLATILTACATTVAPADGPEKERVPVPGGYYQFCEDNPESIFCKGE